jgi:TM2 domain-containing membrane protein YozV
MASPGSFGNMVAAFISLWVPGTGQFFQGRILAAVVHFFAAGLLWFVLLGWLVHLYSSIDAARYRA